MSSAERARLEKIANKLTKPVLCDELEGLGVNATMRSTKAELVSMWLDAKLPSRGRKSGLERGEEEEAPELMPESATRRTEGKRPKVSSQRVIELDAPVHQVYDSAGRTTMLSPTSRSGSGPDHSAKQSTTPSEAPFEFEPRSTGSSRKKGRSPRRKLDVRSPTPDEEVKREPVLVYRPIQHSPPLGGPSPSKLFIEVSDRSERLDVDSEPQLLLRNAHWVEDENEQDRPPTPLNVKARSASSSSASPLAQLKRAGFAASVVVALVGVLVLALNRVHYCDTGVAAGIRCTVCPEHAMCALGRAHCVDGFHTRTWLRISHLALHTYCQKDPAIDVQGKSLALRGSRALKQSLGRQLCGWAEADVSRAAQLSDMRRQYLGTEQSNRADLTWAAVVNAWKADPCLQFRTNDTVLEAICDAELPWSCIALSYWYIWVGVVSLVVLALRLLYARQRRSLLRSESARVKQYIMQSLQERAIAFARGDAGYFERFVSFDYMRAEVEESLSVSKYVDPEELWREVQRLMEADARVICDENEKNGERVRTWELQRM